MKTIDNTMMYENPVVSELNRVPNFDPLKFLKVTENGPKLDLKYKKLWFRLKYPQGRIRLSNLYITDQIAIIEARVFFDCKDTESVSNYTARCDISSAPDGKYLKYAQNMAIEQALNDAGFGIQFSVDSKSTEIIAEKISFVSHAQRKENDNDKKEEYENVLDFSVDDERIIKYLKGETLEVEDLVSSKEKGWYLVCVDGYPLGFGKLSGQMLKNKYLPGWRWQSS